MREAVSIIVPVYKVDLELVKKCVESIKRQTFQDYKVYLIDDGNDEVYKEQLLDLARQYECICISHEENKGLFQARITDVEATQSEYILFVDADDSITVDWLRLLVKKAQEEKSDIVVGKTICVDDNGWRYIRNRSESLYLKENLQDEEIFRTLMKDEGLDFSLHTMWNKLYSRKIWEKALSFLKSCDKHLIMTEDILFSMVLFYYAEKLSFSNHDGYFYYRNSMSSTININGLKKVRKNVEDLIYSFANVKRFMEEKSLFEEYEKEYNCWRDRYFRWWSYNVKSHTAGDEEEAQEIRKMFLEFFDKTDFENAILMDGYFDDARTTWNPGLEEIKQIISSDSCKLVSFDLFDTLIKRPVLHPEDVFEVLIRELPAKHPEKNRFIQIRQAAERYARRKNNLEYPGSEDINLDDIYVAMHSKYGVAPEVCEELKNLEIKLEYEFAHCRNIGKELYELAVFLGKRVVITSDMYLKKQDIQAILDKNGYSEIEEVFLSSDVKLLKSTGNIFDYMIQKVGVAPQNIVHMGDNWQSDHIIPCEKGMTGLFIPKTKDIMFNSLGDKYTGNSIGAAVDNSNSIIDLNKYLKELPIRCFYAVAANHLFDNPFVSFNEYSNYNGSPYMMGYLSMGINTYGIVTWIINKAIEKGYSKVHFTSRDGYYLKEAYDLLREKYYTNAPESNYLYLSRKSLIPVEVHEKEQILDIVNNISYLAHSPESVMSMYHTVLKPLDEKLERIYLENGIALKKKFANVDEFLLFLNLLKEVQFDAEKAEKSYKICQKYFAKEVEKNDVLFDLGYSAKLHKSVVELLDYPIDGLYLHNNGMDSMLRMQEANFHIKAYYDFVPSMSGIINEYFFSEYGPSCIGYEESNVAAMPIFERESKNTAEIYMLDEYHAGCIEFLNNVLDDLGSHINLLKTHNINTGILYEKFLMHIKDFDRDVFGVCNIEDEYYGGLSCSTLKDIWYWQKTDRRVDIKENIRYEAQQIRVEVPVQYENIEYQLYLSKVKDKSKLSKAIYWLLVDRNYFKNRIKEFLHGKN